MLLYSGVVGGQHGHSEWMDPLRQVGGGYLFHPPGQYLPYQGGDQELMPLPRGSSDPHRGMPFNEAQGMYREDVYRGDPRSAYGNFHPSLLPPGTSQDVRGSVPLYQNYTDRPYHFMGPIPHASRSPTCKPHQGHPPCVPPAPVEPTAPFSSAK